MLLTVASDELENISISEMAELINSYGFMIVFSAVVLVIGTFAIYKMLSLHTRKKNIELDLMTEEKKTTIHQQQALFTMLTENQLKQSGSLEDIKTLLTNIIMSINNQSDDIGDVSDNVIIVIERVDKITDSQSEMLKTVDKLNEKNVKDK